MTGSKNKKRDFEKLNPIKADQNFIVKFITQKYSADEEISHEPILNPKKYILKERND